MDTLAPPPGPASTVPSAKPPLPADLLRARSRWQRLGAALLWADAGLLLTLALLWALHPSFLRVTSWGRLPLAWSAGLGVTALGALACWVRGRRSALLRGARSLDENLQAMNRLEAAASLATQAHPIARAQREETAAFLVDHAHHQHRPGHLRVLAWTAAALLLAHLATLTAWTRPWQRPAVPPARVAPKPTPPAPPRATITWKTPKSEIKASPVEEVPLEAVASSATGLRDLVLEVAVNGAPRLSTPIPHEALSKAGSRPVQASLYLDQLEVEPYDMVSYFLRAKRIVREDLPAIVSPVQFVEVKPFRDDVREAPPLPGGPGAFDLLTALKVAQLNLLKQNFVLGHAEINREGAAWRKENVRVGDEQAALGRKADEAIAKFIQAGLPANIVDLLQQSRPLMEDAAGNIRSAKNLDALPVQGKTLGLITEIAKYFTKMAKKGDGKPGPKQVKDPFEKPKDFEMKQRFDTSAGGLEALAREQLKLAQELAQADPKDPDAGKLTPEPPGAEGKQPDPNRIEGTFAERQTLIAQRIGALLNQPVLPPEVNGHLEGGQGHARESLRQLDADDVARAREPAAAAARELRAAVQAMDRLGEKEANDKLADALNALNQAADAARRAADARSDAEARQAAETAAARAAEARDKLAEAARQQQETGSAQAAARLQEAVHALDDAKLRDALRQWHDQPRNEALRQAAAERLAGAAEHAADQQSGKGSPDDIAKLIERIERTRANFERLAMAMPAADSSAASPEGKDPAGQPPGAAGGSPSSGGDSKKAPQGKEGKGTNPGSGHQDKGQGQDKDKGQGQSKEGQDQGQGKDPEQGQCQGEGQGEGRGTSGKRQGQGQGQGGQGTSSGGQGMAGQPSPEQAASSSALGHGGEGQQAATNPAADGNTDAPAPPAEGSGQGGSGEGQGGSARNPRGSGCNPPTEQQAQELMADLRDEALEARVVLANPDARHVLEELYPDIHGPRLRNNIAIVAAYERIRAPLDQLITLLHTELDRSQRQHELTDQTQEKAPSAYGGAVADYFEQLSRDYQPAATPVPADAAPTP